MPRENPLIITRPAAPSGRAIAGLVSTIALVAGAAAALHYARLDLTLSHYDARAHLVVARRVFDSLTPGWRQLGGLWLPLPHLINLLPSAWDWAYRTGAAGVAVSVGTLAWGLGALAGYLLRRTGSVWLAVAAPCGLLLNPNVLYLQATPMTEPLLIGLSLVALAALDRWVTSPDARTGRRASFVLAALVLTRYEGWLIGAALVAIAGFAGRAGGWRQVPRLLIAPAVALAAFAALSRASTGQWLVTSGFFVAQNPALGQPVAALSQVIDGMRELTAPICLIGAVAGVIACAFAARRSAAACLPLALALPALLPIVAFAAGHPERVRYMVPLVAATGVLSAVACELAPARLRGLIGAAIVAIAIAQRPPLTATAPMIVEAQWERPAMLGRRAISAYLAGAYDRAPILASMASLGHYMQESSSIGLRIQDFLHEGNGDLWLDALQSPRRHVRWVLIEEQGRGGDVLALRARENPAFLAGFSRVAEGGGAVLYRRDR